MKKFCIKDSKLFVFILLICFFSSSKFSHISEIIYASVFMAFISALYLIKNRHVAYILSIAIIAVYSVYNVEYAFFIVPVSLLVLIYKNLASKMRQPDSKKKYKSTAEHMLLNLMLILGVAEGICFFREYFKNDICDFIGDINRTIVVAVVMVVLFVSGAFFKSVQKTVTSNFKISSRDYYTLIYTNFVAIILFAVSVFGVYTTYQTFKMNISVVRFPWTVWLCVLVYEKNPITESILKLIEEEIKKISERRIKEK